MVDSKKENTYNYYRCMKTPKEVQCWVNLNYRNEDLKELIELKNEEDKEKLALLFYKGNGYKRMNNYVRNGIVDTNNIGDVNSLQELLLSKIIRESIEVYRFINLKELMILLKNTSKKRVFEYPSFLSTTLLWKYYSMEDIKKGKICIAIRVPKGTHGTYIPEINPSRPEYEILLPHHLKIKRINLTTFEIINDR